MGTAMTNRGKGSKVAVVGAGVFGAWTAHHLQQRGATVTLVDAHGPAHSRASSGGESRVTRAAYGKDDIYTRMAMDSLPQWQALSDVSGLPIFHKAGVLFFFPDRQDYLVDSETAHRALGLPSELLDGPTMQKRFPMIDFTGSTVGLYEPGFGALMARRAVQTLVDRFVRAGGLYVKGKVEQPAGSGRLDAIRLSSGDALSADLFVFAAGPWLPKLFPDVIGPRILPTRQEVFFFAPPAGDRSHALGTMPVWADFNDGDLYYGFPDIEARGVKFAHDQHGPEVDPDTQDRRPSAAALAEVIAYRDRRFPGLRGAPLTEARVCQYENSSNGDFLADFHPQLSNVLLLGAGSGHGFKHGPEVGRHATALLFGERKVEPRFSLATKKVEHKREVV
jgi:glycine/D-amino acid oxidase-like deaminating enzyme